MKNILTKGNKCGVALLAEGVDRNLSDGPPVPECCTSPSSRRAWIEISKLFVNMLPLYVALLAEGVDRNRDWTSREAALKGRPPRGGRG